MNEIFRKRLKAEMLFSEILISEQQLTVIIETWVDEAAQNSNAISALNQQIVLQNSEFQNTYPAQFKKIKEFAQNLSGISGASFKALEIRARFKTMQVIVETPEGDTSIYRVDKSFDQLIENHQTFFTNLMKDIVEISKEKSRYVKEVDEKESTSETSEPKKNGNGETKTILTTPEIKK